MASEKPKQADLQVDAPKLVEQAEQAIAAAKENVFNKRTLEALLNVKPEDLISADSDPEVIKGNAHQSECWIGSPAMVELYAAADKRLTRVAGWMGMPVERVDRVDAKLIKGTKLLVLKPADSNDLSAVVINRYGSTTVFNLVNLLGEAKLRVPKGYRDRFEVGYAPKESPLWPALVIDLGQRKERRRQGATKKEEEEQQPAQAAAKQGKGQRKGAKAAASAATPPAPTQTTAPSQTTTPTSSTAPDQAEKE